MKLHKAEDTAIKQISDKLSSAVKDAGGAPAPGGDTGDSASKAGGPPSPPGGGPPSGEGAAPPPGGGPPPPPGPGGEAPAPGAGLPDLSAPAPPTVPSLDAPPPGLEPPGVPPAGDQANVQQMQQSIEQLSQSVNELVETLKTEIVTMAPPGQARLPQEEGPSIPNTLEGGDVETGFAPPKPMGPFSSSKTGEPNQRRQSMKKQKSTAPATDPQVKRVAEEGVAAAPPENVELVYNEKTDKVDGTKPFVPAPHVTTEGEIERENKSQKKEEGLPELLFESNAALRVARKSRLYAATPADLSKQATDVVTAAAEKKASDLAALQVSRYFSAMELAHKAQERGIESFPLLTALAARLSEAGVANAEIVASDVLSGTLGENYKAAHETALKYMDMSDDAYVQVQATIEKAPPATLRGFARSDRDASAQAVRQAALAGNLGAVTGAPVESPMDTLRNTLRSTGPRGMGNRSYIR